MLQAARSSAQYRVKAASVPAPVGGLNSRDSIDAMPPTDALIMSNFFPTTGKITLRDGYTQFCTGIGSGDVETLIEHSAGSNRQLLAIGSDGVLYQINTGSAVSKKTGLANGRAEHIEFNNLSIIVPSGANLPFSWNGSSASDLSITLSDSVNPNTLTGVHAHKNRVYYWTGTSQNFYHSASVDTFQGNFTKFPVGLVGTFGGNIIMINSLSIDGGEGVDDLLCIIMSSGEVLIYSGSNPSSDFALVGSFRLAEPVQEKRAIAKLGGDVIIMTKEGYLPLSQVVRQDLVGNKAAAISEKIRGTVIAQVAETGTTKGWQIFVSPDGDKVYFNYPTSDAATDPYNQHVFNPIIRAWCIFENLPAVVWGQFNGDTFFGGAGGKVFKVEGKADLGENIVGDLATSYNYFGDRGGVKRFSSVQPMLEGETDVQFDFGVGVDQAPVSGIAVSTTTFASNTAAWDIASWDNFFWADAVGSGITKRRKAVNKFGFSAALRIKVATDSQAISFISAHYTFAPGGPY